jgi:hypothetical protein
MHHSFQSSVLKLKYWIRLRLVSNKTRALEKKKKGLEKSSSQAQFAEKPRRKGEQA